MDSLAEEAAAALLNASRYYFSLCPPRVKLTFRHALCHVPNSAEVVAARSLFLKGNTRDSCPFHPCRR
eukprot:jgi/Chlat1/1750/Chrsp134S02081